MTSEQNFEECGRGRRVGVRGDLLRLEVEVGMGGVGDTSGAAKRRTAIFIWRMPIGSVTSHRKLGRAFKSGPFFCYFCFSLWEIIVDSQ